MKKSYLQYFSIAIILCLITNFYYQFFLYSVDIPVNDDYKAILEFLNNFKATSSFSERFTLIFSQHNEHRIVYDRIWTLITYQIFGVVNFNFLAFIGNLSYFFIFCIISMPFKKYGYVYLIPIAVLIFNFSFHENITFPMATLSNNTGILFILLSIYFAANETKFEYLFIIFYVFAVFTVGSGLFLTPILMLLLWYKGQKKLLIIFSIVALITILFYFFNYQNPDQTHKMIDTFLMFKAKLVLFFFAFLGSIFSYYLIFTNDLNDSLMFASIVGGLMLLFYLFLIKRKLYKTHLFIFTVISFIFLVAILTSASRIQYGLDTAIASRYRLYSALLFIGFYFYILDVIKIDVRIQYFSIIAFSVFYFINISVKQLEYLDYRKNLNFLGAIGYKSGNYKLLNGFEQDLYQIVLEKSTNYKTYSLPNNQEITSYYPFSKLVSNINKTNNTDLWFTQGVEQVYEFKDSFLIFGKGFLDNQSSFTQKIYLVLENPTTKKTVTFETTKIERYDMNPYFKKDNLDYGGFCCRIKKNLIDQEEYNIRLAIENKDLFKNDNTDKKLKKTN